MSFENCKRKKYSVSIGYNFIFHPAIITIKNLTEENKAGKVISAKSQFGTYMPGWHPMKIIKIVCKYSMGGGVILTSIHEQNYLTYMFEKLLMQKHLNWRRITLGIDSEEGAEILMKHQTGVVSKHTFKFFQKPYYRNCQIIGSEGTIYLGLQFFRKENSEKDDQGNY